MSKTAKEFYEVLKNIASPNANVLPAIVKKVNGNDTVDVDVNGVTYYDVNLKASEKSGQKGIRIKPAVDSLILIERIGDQKSDEWVVLMYSEVDEVLFEIAAAKFLMDKDGFIVSNGADTLKDAIKLIIEAVQVIVVLQGKSPDYAKLTQALTKLNKVFK